MRASTPQRLELARTFEKARAAAAAVIRSWNVEIALYAPANCYCPPGQIPQIGAELEYSGYERQSTTLGLVENGLSSWAPMGGNHLRLSKAVTFKRYDGEFPLVVTHIGLQCAETGMKIVANIRPVILHKGDCLCFGINSITLPLFDQEWEDA